MRTLSALGAASRSQDRLGLAQRREPKVGDVLCKLLSLNQGAPFAPSLSHPIISCLLAAAALRDFQVTRPAAADDSLRMIMRLAPAMPSGSPAPEAVLADVVQTALFTFLDAFGVAGCLDALQTARAPDYGSVAEHSALLKSMADS